MPDVKPPRVTVPDMPARWPRLLLLGVAVFALHMVLLVDGLPDLTLPSSTLKTEPQPTRATRQPAQGSDSASANPLPVHVSKVRWIVPAPAVAPVAPVPARQVAAPVRPAPVPARVATSKPVAAVESTPVAAPVAEVPPPPTPDMAPVPDPQVDAALAEAAPVEREPQVEPAAAVATPVEPLPEAEPVATSTQRPLPAAEPPASTRLQYVVTGQAKGFVYNATGTLDWELGGGRYNARMEMRMPLLGSRVQTSTGAVGPEGLMPERFADKGRSERAAHFERDQHRIRFSANTPDAELLPGAQDRLSLFLQMAGLLQARSPPYASGQVIDMQVAGTGDAEIWRFQVGEESTLALPAGELRVRHLVRQPRKEFDSTVEMWLAPELNHLPVRLKVTQANGDMADQQLSQKP